MSIYIVGDIQGCYDPLRKLLDAAQFDSKHDQLWSVGDVVNRGPDSLLTLRYLRDLGSSFKMVLGNHDLHLIAVVYGKQTLKKNDTFHDILTASDRDDLIHWLRHQPLIYQHHKSVLVHAGLPHIWPLEKTISLASEVENILQSDSCADFLSAMYGNDPNPWRDELCGMERLRVITNYLTRMRVCKIDGTLDLTFKKSPEFAAGGFLPWFDFYNSSAEGFSDVFFGHWASLEGKTNKNNFHALDSGCVWGGCLTLLRLDDKKIFICDCQ